MAEFTAYKFRAYPNRTQQAFFAETFSCVRYVKNLCLDYWETEWQRANTRFNLNAFDLIPELPGLKEELPWLKRVPSHALQQAVVDAFVAIKRFKAGESGYPRRHRKGEGDSFRLPDPKEFACGEKHIDIPKVGKLRWVRHREIVGKIKNVTISKELEEYYVSVLCEIPEPVRATPERKSVGIDMGVAQPLTLSTGDVFMLYQMSAEDRHKQATLQRKVSRKKKGSKNRRKAQAKLSKFQRHIKRKRVDSAHKATTTIAKNHGTVYVEDLKIRNMTASAKGTTDDPGKNVAQKAGLNRVILDAAPRRSRTLLEYKTRRQGYATHAVPPAYTSQRCSKCGYVHADNRKTQAEFLCLKCGYAANADVNAARNIEQLGITNSRISVSVGTTARKKPAKRVAKGVRQQEARSFRAG